MAIRSNGSFPPPFLLRLLLLPHDRPGRNGGKRGICRVYTGQVRTGQMEKMEGGGGKKKKARKSSSPRARPMRCGGGEVRLIKGCCVTSVLFATLPTLSLSLAVSHSFPHLWAGPNLIFRSALLLSPLSVQYKWCLNFTPIRDYR